MRAFNQNRIILSHSILELGEKNNSVREFLVKNFTKHLLDHKESAEFEFNKLEIFVDPIYKRETIIRPPLDLIASCNFTPIRNIMWGEIVVGYLSLNSRHLNSENETHKMMNLGLILDLLKYSLEPLSLQLFEGNREVLTSNPWVTYIIEADFKHPVFSEGELDFILQLDLAAIVVALGLKKIKRR